MDPKHHQNARPDPQTFKLGEGMGRGVVVGDEESLYGLGSGQHMVHSSDDCAIESTDNVNVVKFKDMAWSK